MRKILLTIMLAAALLGVHEASAQYYTWGSDAPMKWQTIRTPDVRMIYPDTVSALARRTLHYIRTVQPDISFGFSRGPMRIPFVLHPENFQSNGLVMYLPKRVEFLTSPAIEGYSMPWCKQLVAHEYRHAVQYNNIDYGFIRILKYVLGQQGSVIGLLCMPIWAMEGDAVMSETMMSSFGRGLQPSFTMAYRAMHGVGEDRRNVDKWFCGSYKEYVPDHYQLGYQICSYAYDRYGENVWNKVTRYGARNLYVIATARVALGKYYDTSSHELFRAAFDDLKRYWDSLPQEQDSAEALVELPEDNYTTYSWPLPLDDSTALVLKSDFDRPSRFVRLDTRTGQERTVCYTGSVSTRPSLSGGRIWWTEYRRSTLFEQRVNSQLCYMDLSDRKPRTVHKVRAALYPTASPDRLAYVEYAPSGRYTVVAAKADTTLERYPVELGQEIHGLAWDDGTQAYYVIVTDNSGMWLGRIGADGLHPVTRGAYITLSNLRAKEGKLYFGSIQSGKDEAHMYDLVQGREYRITTSAYGAFSPVPAQGKVLLTTYDRRGYRVAAQRADSGLIAVTPAQLPRNVVNPPRKRWDVVNLDTVDFTRVDSVTQTRDFRSKRYRKVPNLVNIHSWMPLAFNPFEAVDEHNISLNLGVTLLSQNLLSNTEAFASYGWNHTEGSLFRLGVRYFGLGVHFDFDAAYGGNQVVYRVSSDQARPDPDKYYSVGLTASLPLYFQRGYHTRQFSVSTGWNYSNGMVARLDKIEWQEGGGLGNVQYLGYEEGLHKLSFGVGYSDFVRSAHRDVAPPWGYQLSANYTFNPANSHFSDLVSLYGKLYTPGFFAHNSVVVAVNYQTSIGGYKFPNGYAPLSYRSARLIPRGFSSNDIVANNYIAAAFDYQFPVWCPEGGIGSVLYFKRIRLNIGGDYAQFQSLGKSGMNRNRIWAVGGDIVLDINAFRQPASATSTVKLSLYHPSSGGVWFGASLGLPF